MEGVRWDGGSEMDGGSGMEGDVMGWRWEI